MVVFCCDGCGDMLKKNQVDVHANKCRRCDSVSCIDCLVKFYGDDYRSHTSCVTEVERYEKKGSDKKKKKTPQQQWMDLIQASIAHAPTHLKHSLGQIAQLDNVPRKEKQFRNFTQNSLRHQPASMVDAIWKYLNEQRQKQAKDNTENSKTTSTTNKVESQQEEQEQADPKQQQPLLSEKAQDIVTAASLSQTNNETTATVEFQPKPKMVHKAVRRALRKAPCQAMKLKELRRVVQQMVQEKRLKKKLNSSDGDASSSLMPILSNPKEWKQLIKVSLAEAHDVQIDGKVVRLKD